METTRLLNVAELLLCSVLVQCSDVPTWVGVRKNIKHILVWGDPTFYPTRVLGERSSAFIQHKCQYTNCYVTTDRKMLDITDYDAIIFNGRDLPTEMPEKRSPKQKYVYQNMESSHNYPVCDNKFNDFFNWTWTYKLNSDALWSYLRIYNLNGDVLGPRIDMHWSELGDVDNKTKTSVKNKTVAAAWFVSNCGKLSGRLKFVNATQKELSKYGHAIHIYGKCGDYSCNISTPEKCNKMIENDYFFYLAFENSFAEDYVTEKVLTGLNNYAVPVVFGDANYSRFLPPGSYLDARELGPEGLAQRMASIIRSYNLGQTDDYYDFFSFLPPGRLHLDARELGPEGLAQRMASIIRSYKLGRTDDYYDFFRWRSRYVITNGTEAEYVCNACADLNNPELMSTVTVYENFTQWWNSKHAKCKAHSHSLSC